MNFALFDFVDANGSPQRLHFADPFQVMVATRLDEVIPVLERVQHAVDAGAYAAGVVAYEAAPAFDPAFCVRTVSDFPLAWFGLFGGPSEHYSAPVSSEQARFHWTTRTSEAHYREAVAAIREAIAAGETYQVNYSVRLESDFAGDALAVYESLRAAQQAHYSAYLDLGRYRVLSVSPELFFRRSGNSITVRPMKGTCRRGRWEAEDAALAAALVASQKERAENIMIVDLLRNDLGRIAEVGSVRVTRLFEAERYPTLWQMTSTVEATLREGSTLTSLFRALFPCGSVTGAPKVSTMRRIAALEETSRQVYCGAIGYLTPGHESVFNVAIRTALHDRETGRITYGVGSGVTWDSTAEGEYAELWTKAAVIREPAHVFELLETFRVENGEFGLLERHLQRLEESARYFGIPLFDEAIRHKLSELADRCRDGVWRGRLLVAQDGQPRLEAEPLTPWPDPPLRVALSTLPISSQDRFLFHKTTHRATYMHQRSLYPDAFDVLMVNERGELTEFTLGNLVLERDGIRWTPPREVGLLAGTLRAELLERGEIAERCLTAEDLQAATGIWLFNSVRGWVPVRFIPQDAAGDQPE